MYSYFSYFISYSFIGFLLETAFAIFIQGEFASRKCFLISFMCPVYGLGAIAILAATQPMKQNPLFVFVVGMAAASLVEFFTDIFYREILETPFWDYSKMPMNIGGRICLLFSVIWGVLSVVLVYIIHPLMERGMNNIPKSLMIGIFVFFAMDAVISAVVLQRFKTKEAISMRWLLQRIFAA